MTGVFTHAKTETRTAAQWWESAGETLSPSRSLDSRTGTTANTALILATHAMASEVVDELVRAGANIGTTRAAVGQVRTLPEGGDVLDVELHLPEMTEPVLLLMIPQRAVLPVYRWVDRELADAEPVITVTVDGAVDGQWLDLRLLAKQLLPMLGITSPSA